MRIMTRVCIMQLPVIDLQLSENLRVPQPGVLQRRLRAPEGRSLNQELLKYGLLPANISRMSVFHSYSSKLGLQTLFKLVVHPAQTSLLLPDHTKVCLVCSLVLASAVSLYTYVQCRVTSVTVTLV